MSYNILFHKIMIKIILYSQTMLNYNYYRSIFLIGFGGNVIRENVKQRAQWFVTNFDDLAKCL